MGRYQETNQAKQTTCGTNNHKNCSPNVNQNACVAYTGPTMVMVPGIHFSPTDWAKLTEAQKNNIFEL
jgi:hypothetical protein